MADEDIQTTPDGSTTAETVPTAPKRATRGKNAAAGKPQKNAPAPAKSKSRGLSAQERLEKMAAINAQVASGGKLKDAVKVAGISDQTYYQWKKATVEVAAVSVPVDDEFAEFMQLEEENRQLRKLLAEKLRAENAELRKRLGLK